MDSYKFVIICLGLFLVQSSLAKPVDDSSGLLDSSAEEMRNNPTPTQKIILFAVDNFNSLSRHYSTNAFNVSRNILKDESLMANDKPEVLEFKKYLTMFVEKYEAIKNPQQLLDIIDIYTDTIDKYTDVPEEKLNPESKFIAEIVKKYNITNIQQTIELFIKNFDKMFEDNKADLNKPMLEWYVKYSSLTDYGEKIDAFNGFIELA